MAVKKLTEGATSGKKFPNDVVMYVDGNQIDVSGDFADAVYDACSEYSGLEGWIREYMNSLGDPIDPDGTMDLSELCYWFARELEMDFDDSDDFYVDGSGIVDNNDMSVEIFVEDGIEERMVRKVTPKRIKKEARMVNGKPRALSPQYDSRKSFYNKAHVVDDNDGNSTLYSYNTPVCRITDGKVELLPKWDYSATTLRHVKDFLQQNGFEAGSKAQIAKKYSVVEESSVRTMRTGRSLNEDFDGGYKILARPGLVTMHEYNYDKGEGKFVNEWDIDIRGTYSSMQDFINAVERYEDVPSDPNEWGIIDGRLITNFLADSDSISATYDEVDAWKRGEETLYLVDVDIPVEIVTTRKLTEDDADMLGVQVW
jgi:hypothetical protein